MINAISFRRATKRALMSLVVSVFLISAAQAQLKQFVLYRDADFSQNSTSAPTTPFGYFFTARNYMVDQDSFDGATLTYPGPGSPATYTSTGMDTGGFYQLYQTPYYPDKASFDAAFPAGNYSTTATNSVTLASQTTSLTYSSDAYPLTIPALTPAGYQTIQNLNVANPAVINFTPFVPDPSNTSAYIFFDIYDSGNNDVYSQQFIGSTQTSLSIPANTLLPGANYTFRLIFSDRIDSVGPIDGMNDELGFDYGDNGSFTTAVPEPASLCLIVIAGAGLFARRRK
jgi:hypothetical protein